MRQVGDEVAGGGAADARPHLGEGGVLRGDGEVTEVGEVVAAADGVAVDAGDHRLHAVLDAGVRVHRRGALGSLPLNLLEPADVAAGAEGAVAGAGDDDDPDFRIGAGVLDGLAHLGQRLAGEGVHHVGTVDGDPSGAADAAVLLEEDVLVFAHDVSLMVVAWQAKGLWCPQRDSNPRSPP